MTEEMVAHLNSTAGEGVEGHGKVEAESHIGISNAIGRLHMYYGAQAKVRIESQAGEGTSIYIEIPKI
jgi:sensor histidine kinase YesM